MVIEIDQGKWLTPDLTEYLVSASLEVWSKNTKGENNHVQSYELAHLWLDPIFISILTDIMASLASSPAPGIYETAVKKSLPILTASTSSAKEESWVASTAIDLVSSLVKGAPESGLGDGFFNLFGPSLFACLNVAEDRDVLQVGISVHVLCIIY